MGIENSRNLDIIFKNKKMEKFELKKEMILLQEKINSKKNEVLQALVNSELNHIMWTINDSNLKGKDLEEYIKQILQTVVYKSTLIEKGDM